MAVKLGLALGSGGARGWCHIGVLRALEEEGLAPDMICGASMGSLVGAAYVSGVLDPLEDFARSISQVTVARMLDVNIASGGLIEGKSIDRKLRSLGFKPSFSDLDKPFLAVASDLYAGCEVWLREGDLVKAVRASIGIPGILSPVWHQERWLLDGGMSNPVPVSGCRALGAHITIAVNPNSRVFTPTRAAEEIVDGPEFGLETLIDAAPVALKPALKSYLTPKKKSRRKPPGYLDVLTNSINFMTDQIRRSRLAGDPPNIMVDLNLGHMSILDFGNAAEAIDQGYAAMKEKIPLLRSMI